MSDDVVDVWDKHVQVMEFYGLRKEVMLKLLPAEVEKLWKIRNAIINMVG